jgi:hypothetical protein
MSTVQLSNVSNFDTERIIFSEAKETNIPGSYRITIGTRYPDNLVGPLIFSTDTVYSFGIQENKSMDKPVRTTGYSIPLCLWNKEGPTEYQKEFIEAVENVSDAIKRYMLRPEVKKSVKKYDLVESDLRKFSPLWYKKEDGEIVQGRGPMLYPKLMCNKDLEIYTDIADQNGHTVDPMTLLNQKCSVRACVKIESIFIGSKISLQVKVVELEVQQQAPGRQRLICKQEPTEVVRIEPSDVLTSVNPLGNPLGDEDASDEEPTEPETTSGEIEVSDEEPEPVEPVPEPVPTKKAARGRKTVKA